MKFAQDSGREGPCAGYRILELSTMISGPMGAQILSDLGADVIKVEALEGDVMRGFSTPYKGMSSYFHHYNRSKRSIAVNLKSVEGCELVRGIAEKCDVLIENFRPGVADRLGLGYEVLKEKNPGLVYVSVNGFGDAGPYKDRPAYDHVVQALSGFMERQGAGGAPAAVRAPVVDKVAAMSAAMSVLAALLARHNSAGNGQKVNVKMFDAWAAFILHEQLVNATFLTPDAPQTPVIDIYRVFPTKDGHVLGLVLLDGQFRGICTALDVPSLLSDPRFSSAGARVANMAQLNDELAPHIARMTTEQFMAKVVENEVPFGPVNDLQGFLADPQAKANGSYFEFEDPDFGTLRNLNFFSEFGGTPLDLHHRAPKLGEHTDAILQEFDHSAPDIERLRAAKIVR
ncbi:CaiB/BaiF CoA transferase family protein [Paraburkholderia sediminicola]|uniref:CaiB/BaiF CoA transferase family protein n=1 Tax=Paraburkholderia sediminicola TaxID=458836 RepID=UPI000E72FD58